MDSEDHDYSVCPDSLDGKHDPKPADVHDREMPDGYFTIECSQCGQTTGYPMPAAEDITW
jgi:rRNA maturation protein Nop10